MRSSSGDLGNHLVVLLFVSAEDRIRQVEECGRSGCQYEFSVPRLHSAVYELFVETAMIKECLIRRHLKLFWYLREEWRWNIHIQGVMCIWQAFVQLYTHTHLCLWYMERHMIASFWLRWESASQRRVSCLLTRAENRSHAWSVELVSCLVL